MQSRKTKHESFEGRGGATSARPEEVGVVRSEVREKDLCDSQSVNHDHQTKGEGGALLAGDEGEGCYGEG